MKLRQHFLLLPRRSGGCSCAAIRSQHSGSTPSGRLGWGAALGAKTQECSASPSQEGRSATREYSEFRSAGFAPAGGYAVRVFSISISKRLHRLGIEIGAGGRSRTDTWLPMADFES